MSDQYVPYAPDFTPSTLGKVLGEDRVLAWLLRVADESASKAALSLAIQEKCLQHVDAPKSRADMASHVVQGLQNYQLITIENDVPQLTLAGRTIFESPPELRDLMFARHILASCNGMRLVEAVQRFMLRRDRATLEVLASQLDRHATSKNISTMKAWLARAGLFTSSAYEIDPQALDRILGSDVAPMFGMSTDQMELLLAARLIEAQTGDPWVRASDAKELALARRPMLTIPHKSLSGFVKELESRGLVETGSVAGKGGAGTTMRLIAAGRLFSEEQIRTLLAQSDAGIALAKLRPLSEVLVSLDVGHAQARGEAGEMLAIHLCLALGLRVESWRSRAPEAEIDLMAERSIGLSYQRWAIQVKNTGGKVDSDRIDREVGAAAGSGTTHLLFIAPRTTLTEPAQREAMARSRLTSLHVYFLDEKAFPGEVSVNFILDQLTRQQHLLAMAKRHEARRRQE